MVHNQVNQCTDINTADIPLFIWRLISTFCHYRLSFSHPNNETYAVDLFGSSVQSAGPRIGLSLPDTAAELQASPLPLLSAQPATCFSPPASLPTSYHSDAHPCQQFLRSESGSYLSLRQTLINSDAPRVNKMDLHDLSSPLKQANLAPKSIPVANRSRKVRTLLARHNHCTTIVPHNTRECQVAAAGLQRAWAASLVLTAAKPHSLPASAHPSSRSPRRQRRMQPGLYLLFPDANT